MLTQALCGSFVLLFSVFMNITSMLIFDVFALNKHFSMGLNFLVEIMACSAVYNHQRSTSIKTMFSMY